MENYEKTKNPAYQRYLAINSFEDLNNLVEDGASEDLYFECKSQPVPTRLSPEVLAKTIAGFSNTAGGVILWGAETDKKDGNDVITQLMPIGNIAGFKARVANLFPTLTVPSIIATEFKIIKARDADTKGYLVAYVPPLVTQPTQSLKDNCFYIRTGDQFNVAPYEFIQRMFAAQQSPDMRLIIPKRLIKRDPASGEYALHICLNNESLAVGRDVFLSLEALDGDKFEVKSADSNFKDMSHLNDQRRIFSTSPKQVFHKGFSILVGQLKVSAKGKSKVFAFKVDVFADKMLAHHYRVKLRFSKEGAEILSAERLT